MHEESLLSEELLDRGCTCFQCPPCSFCTSLNEKEADVYANSGIDGLRKLIRTPNIEDYNIW